jgi:hypothetical protein
MGARVRHGCRGVLALSVILLIGGVASARASGQGVAGLSVQASSLAETVSVEWSKSLGAWGNIVDPVTHEPEGGYGASFLAYGMLRADERTPTLNLRPTIEGILARPNAVAQNPFSLLALSELLLHDNGALPSSLTQALATKILSAPRFGLRSLSAPCFERAGCYDNLKLVNATALEAALAALPGRAGGAGSVFADPAQAAQQVRRLLSTTIPEVELPSARLLIGRERLTGATLSDPRADPTAYVALSAMMLGRALELYPLPPRRALLAFERTVVSLLGLAAPDGDVSYMGRGQGQIWTYASAAAACAMAIRLLPSQRAIAGRCEGLVATELRALAVRKALGGVGIATVPRLGWTEGDGVDHYGNPTDYNGLTVYALNTIADALAGTADPPAFAVPGAVEGERFLDRAGSSLATSGLHGLWFAVHGGRASESDSRWGFGLMAMQRERAGAWVSRLTPRPMGYGVQGPALVIHGRYYEPRSRRMTVSLGKVVLDGGWAGGNGVVQRASFSYQATALGVRLSFFASRREELRVAEWVLPGHQGIVEVSGGRSRTVVSAAAGDDESPRLVQLTHVIHVRDPGTISILWRG